MSEYFCPPELSGIDLALPLLMIHFERNLRTGGTRFSLKRKDDGRLTLTCWGREFYFPHDWYDVDPRTAVNGFVRAMLENVGSPPEVTFKPMGSRS
jgi:hypothetical protein